MALKSATVPSSRCAIQGVPFYVPIVDGPCARWKGVRAAGPSGRADRDHQGLGTGDAGILILRF